jgi:hypothetical protein
MLHLEYPTFPKKDNSEDLALVNEDGDKLCSVCRLTLPDMCLRTYNHWIHFACCNSTSYRTHICEICDPIIPHVRDWYYHQDQVQCVVFQNRLIHF